MQCRKLVVIFNSSDCGSKYKKAMEIHTENIANGNTDNDLQHLRVMLDMVCVVNCLPCSPTSYSSSLLKVTNKHIIFKDYSRD